MECVNCKKGVKFACANCEECPVVEGDHPLVQYCSAECQKADLTKHKATCQRLQDRQKVYRVGQVTQKMFMIFQELTWCQLKIEKVEKDGQSFTLRGRKFEQNTWPKEYIIFPSHLVPSPEDRVALLSFHGCWEALAWIVEFSNGFLKDIITKSELVEFQTKNDKLKMKLIPPGGNNIFFLGSPNHEIIKVILRSGEAFAFDITGAQYGYPEPITPWQIYQEQRVFEIVKTSPDPKSKGLIQVHDYSLTKMIHFYNAMQAISSNPHSQVSGDTISAMNFHFLEWQADKKLSFTAMWKLPDKKFETKMTDMVNFMDWKFNSVPGKAYFTVNGRQQARDLRGGKWVHGK